MVSSAVLSKIISDPTQISSGSLDITTAQKSAAIRAYSMFLLLVHYTRPNSLTFSGQGIQNIYYFMVACCCVSFLVTIIFVRSTSLRRDDDARLQEEGKKWAAKHRGIHALGKKNVDTVSNSEKAPASTVEVPESQVKCTQ